MYPPYFRHSKHDAQKLGLRVKRLKLGGLGSISENTNRLVDFILARSIHEDKLLGIGHSAGGVLLANAISMDSSVKEAFSGIGTLLSPLKGFKSKADIGTHFSERFAPRSMHVLGELSTDHRTDFLKANPYPSDMTTLNLTSSTDRYHPVFRHWAPLIGLSELNDGYVPTTNQFLEGQHVAHLEGLDHGSVAWQLPGGKQVFQGALVKSMVDTLVEIKETN